MKIESILFFLFLILNLVCCNAQPKPEESAIDENNSAPQFQILTDDDVRQGAERMELYVPGLKEKRIALVVNQTSVIGKTHLVDSLISLGIHIQHIFAPEHGFRGKADAGEHIQDGVDSKTGLNIYSLYGSNKKPKPEWLEDLDVVVFDIQDVGARFYTYLSTMHYIMEACAENNIECIILDRPNPNGFYVDGPVLEAKYRSFVGMHKIPVVHGMTFGELATMIQGEGWIAGDRLELKVVLCEGYRHNCTFELPVLPSPNLPNLRSILLYPSLCFFEPTDYSVGRGTDLQFQILGRPGGSGDFEFIPTSKPGATSPKHEGVRCQGYNLSSYELNKLFDTQLLDLSFLLNNLSGQQVERITNPSFFDKLAGNSTLRIALSENWSEQKIRESWNPDLEIFKKVRSNYLKYK